MYGAPVRASDGLDGVTRDPLKEEAPSEPEPELALTIAHHPEVERVGERIIAGGARFAVSRLEPKFEPVRGGDARPISDAFVSRSALTGKIGGGSLILEGSAVVDGEALEGSRTLPLSALDRGVVLELAKRVVVVVHRARRGRPQAELGLVGESDVIQVVRREIERVAVSPVAVLVRGETGTGKELAAHAIHLASARSKGPFIAVSAAALSPSVAASELFGHKKGAFTGAAEDRAGCFRRAHGGTLFLDEIGECPIDVQVALLRAIDAQTIQPVGADREEKIDVRLITATDADLEAAVAGGKFRAPLLHRLAGYELFLPPLRDRREDIGRLLRGFLATHGAPALSSTVVARLVAYDWPGNVRQLKNVAAQLAIAGSDGAQAIDRVLARLPAAAPLATDEDEEPVSARRKPGTITSDELLASLERNAWNIDRTAADLGISRPSVYRRIAGDPKLRKAKDLSRSELAAALDRAGGDLVRMSEELRVSKAGLRLRLMEEGLTPRGRSR